MCFYNCLSYPCQIVVLLFLLSCWFVVVVVVADSSQRCRRHFLFLFCPLLRSTRDCESRFKVQFYEPLTAHYVYVLHAVGLCTHTHTHTSHTHTYTYSDAVLWRSHRLSYCWFADLTIYWSRKFAILQIYCIERINGAYGK